MKNEKKRYAVSEDDFLDYLVKLAFDQDDLEKAQSIMKAAEEGTSGPDVERARCAWQAALRRANCLKNESDNECSEDS